MPEKYKIDIAVPTLSYGQDATPRGLVIAERFAAPGLQEAAALAVKATAENSTFDGHWDEIRAELASERTFWTGLYLKKGIEEIDAEHNAAIKFTGCPIDPAIDKDAVDAVSSDHPVKKCTMKDDSAKTAFLHMLQSSPDLGKLEETFQNFLNTVAAAVGLPPPPDIPKADYSSKGALPEEYDELAALASIIEMIAELGPPLQQLFQSAQPLPSAASAKLVVERGVNSLGIRFFTSEPSPLSDAVSVFPVNYMMSRPKGSHTIVVSHDNMMSALMSSLKIICSESDPDCGKSDPDDWAFYPIESYVFAFGNFNVSVVRMRVQVRDPDGAVPGNYASEVVWNGTLNEWNQKVRELNQRANTLNLGDKGNACVAAVKECKAQQMNVAFYTRLAAPPPGATPPPPGSPPCSSFTDLIHAIRNTDLPPKAQKSLRKKLRAAAAFLDQGDDEEAHDMMEAFFRALTRLKDNGQLDAATADALAECGHTTDQSIVERF